MPNNNNKMPSYTNFAELNELVNSGDYRDYKKLKKSLAELSDHHLSTDAGRTACAAAIKTILTPVDDTFAAGSRKHIVVHIVTSGIEGALTSALSSCWYKSRGVYNTDRTSAAQNTGSNTSGKEHQSTPAPGKDDKDATGTSKKGGTTVSSSTSEQITMIDWTVESSAIKSIAVNIAHALEYCNTNRSGVIVGADKIETATGLKWA